MSIYIDSNPVYVTIDADGTAVFQTTVSSSYTYSGFGATMSGSGSATVRQEDIHGDWVGDDEIRYYFKTRATTTSTGSYGGEMYAGGGGTATTSSESIYEVWFTAYLVSGGNTYVKGEITVKPAEATPGSIDTTMSFTCMRMS